MADSVTVKRKSKQKVIIDSIWNRRSLFGFKTSVRNESQRHTEKKPNPATLSSEMAYKWSKREKTKSVTEVQLVNSSGETHPEVESPISTTFRYGEGCQHYSFVSAFGKKGKEIGEYQDAKTISCSTRGKILVSDYVNSRLQICSDSSKTVTAFSPDEIAMPWAAIVTRENNIAVTMCQDRCVKIFNMDGDVITPFGKDHFMKPTGIATDKTGNFTICDSVTNKVSIFDNQGSFVRCLGNSDVKEECFNKPCYVCISITDDIIVSDGGNHKIKVFSSEGDFVRSFGSFGKGDMQFKSPCGVATDKFGDIFVADHNNSRISMFTRDGVFIRHIVTSDHGLVHPQGLTICPDMLMYVSHGHLKASEILVFKLATDVKCESSDFIAHF